MTKSKKLTDKFMLMNLNGVQAAGHLWTLLARLN